MGFSIRNSRLVSVGLAGVIAVGVVGATAVAFADEPDGGSQQANPDNGARKHHPIVLGVSALLKDSGVTRDELKQGGQDGLTLAQIIDQYGDISSAQAKQHALDALSTRLDEAVASGKIKQEEADKIEANSPAMLDKLLAAVPGEHRGDKHPRIHAIAKNALETVANVLGTDVATLRQQLAGGQTIAEIAGPQTQAVSTPSPPTPTRPSIRPWKTATCPPTRPTTRRRKQPRPSRSSSTKVCRSAPTARSRTAKLARRSAAASIHPILSSPQTPPGNC
jgi:hypothetical protein